MRSRQHPFARDRSRGVAALELALSLSFLVPLMLAALDFGYYFYVGANAEEAARQGAQQAVRLSAGQPCGSAQSNAAYTVVHDRYPLGPTGIACLAVDTRSAVYCYMNEPPLRMAASSSSNPITQVTTLQCDNNPVANTWHIVVDVTFNLVAGFYRPLLPAGLVGTDTVRYRASLTATP